MEYCSVNVGFIDVMFMCGNGKGLNVARGPKQFIAAARAIDKDFFLLPLGGQDKNHGIPEDVPHSKEGIQKYFRHRVSVNNVAGSIKIQTKFSISRLKHPSSSDTASGRGHNKNDSDVTSPTVAETATQQTQPRTVPSPRPQVSPTQQTGPASPPSEGAMSGLANMKCKLSEIEKEREKSINSQQKIKDDVSEMTDSFTKMSGDMVNLRKDLSDLSESVGRQMKELKEMMSSLINSRLIPMRGSPKRKKGKSSGTEHGLSSDETGTRPPIHASK
jgi:hypothetical protein